MAGSVHLDNIRLWTGNAKQPLASSLTIRTGKVVALDREPPSDIVRIDAMGATAGPGLIDSHLHLTQGGVFLSTLDLRQVRSRAEFETAIAAENARLPDDQWLIGTGWSEVNWQHASHDDPAPDQTWLAAAGDRPCVCYRMDLHAAVVNQAVLDRIDATSDPPGGRIVRDEATGRPSGLLLEAALWQRVLPLIPEPNRDQLREAVRLAQQHLNRLGVTAVGAMEYENMVERALVPRRDDLTVRTAVTLLDRELPLDTSYADSFTGDDVLSIIGFKAFIDGTLGSRTAALLEPYADDTTNLGVLVELAESGRLNDWCRRVVERGYSPAMHAIGDRAMRLALDAAEAVATASASPTTFARFEHAQQIDSADLPRMNGRIASMQPLHKADDGRYARHRLGPDRMAGFFAFRSLLEHGATLAFGSDWPVVSADPMQGMRAAITGRSLDGDIVGPEQNLTAEEAMRAYTVDAAQALQLNECGVLREGMHGDLVLYDRDPFSADWTNAPPCVTLTIVDGDIVFDGRASAEMTSSSAARSG